ncbi:(p)ppGpp synthase/HD superfamily hydrolase [Pseudomonas brassicacearum]|jgi:(p)ppGpp synthase/HD superfamily hydrolase|uniref:(P)ppGpp synthase/HD superfamily hydrolase n=1 Tax=Pseudomonas brassicacearum TaxID=930166 RepID=A0AAW8MK73_9PSED|nr:MULTISPECIES: GTP pyrophosphokinase [Pseudomonas]MDR6962100.1 (p)ppGpp synthase/HD superfamily hydrolase [Pseudomonas brassicacearum]UZE17886.1 GTP pyrophosphokinase [Pseudomonas sp. B21-054]
MSILDAAIALASRVHAGQVDKAGKPYILHPLRLMMKFDGLEEQLVSLLHDVVEDGDVTLDELRELGIPETAVTAIDCLTKRQGESYDQFIARIRPNSLATKVKIADIHDNLDLTRLPVLRDKDLERAAKYHRALLYLQKQPEL